MVTTLVDVAQELNWSYFQAKRNNLKSTKDKSIFVEILKNLFEMYGNYFGYDNSQQGLSNFKSDVIRIKNRLKKEKEKVKKAFCYRHPDLDERFWRVVEMSPIFRFKEGDGEIFTQQQVEFLELNQDSY